MLMLLIDLMFIRSMFQILGAATEKALYPWIISFPTVIDGNKDIGLNLEWKIRKSVLSAFNFSLLQVIQLLMSARQDSNRKF